MGKILSGNLLESRDFEVPERIEEMVDDDEQDVNGDGDKENDDPIELDDDVVVYRER